MGFSALAAIAAVGTAATVDSSRRATNTAKDNANRVAEQEAQAQAIQIDQFKKEQAALAKSQADQMSFEQARADQLKISQADAALAAQNTATSTLTATVQAGGTTQGTTAADSRKRRAEFRPEYASGVTI